MKNRFIAFFRRGRWLQIAASYLTNPRKLQELLHTVSQLLNRKGWEQLRDNATLLYQYASDVTSGRYTGYNTRALLLVIAALIYLVTPIDLLPDFFLGGLIDDTAVLVYIVHTISNELLKYKERKL